MGNMFMWSISDTSYGNHHPMAPNFSTGNEILQKNELQCMLSNPPNGSAILCNKKYLPHSPTPPCGLLTFTSVHITVHYYSSFLSHCPKHPLYVSENDPNMAVTSVRSSLYN